MEVMEIMMFILLGMMIFVVFIGVAVLTALAAVGIREIIKSLRD